LYRVGRFQLSRRYHFPSFVTTTDFSSDIADTTLPPLLHGQYSALYFVVASALRIGCFAAGFIAFDFTALSALSFASDAYATAGLPVCHATPDFLSQIFRFMLLNIPLSAYVI